MEYRAIWDHMIIKADINKLTASWIIMPIEDANMKTNMWTVLCIWDWELVEELWVSEWDRVVYKKYLPDTFEVKIDWEKVKLEIAGVQHILAVVTGEEDTAKLK